MRRFRGDCPPPDRLHTVGLGHLAIRGGLILLLALVCANGLPPPRAQSAAR